MEKRDPPWKNIVDSAVVGARIDPKIVMGKLGKPHLTNESGDGEAGPCDYWCYEFCCGLWVLATSHRQGYFNLRSNSFEPNHVIKHFPWVADFEHQLCLRENVYMRTVPDWFIPKNYNVLRVDNLGNRFDVRSNVPEYESLCVIGDFEKGLHKQGYFRESA